MPDLRARLTAAFEQAAGRLATGDPTKAVVTDVHVRCRRCGGVTVFPVLCDGGRRPTPAPCAHCGADI